MQARDNADLSFEAWQQAFAGRVETVEADGLYVVKLEDADGEFHLGLVASEGKVLMSVEDGEQAQRMKALWFQRCSSNHGWGPNPEFEQYMDGARRMADTLPTESFLLKVEESDLTEASVSSKWSKPKLKQTLMKKLRWIADKYSLNAAPAPAKKARRKH